MSPMPPLARALHRMRTATAPAAVRPAYAAGLRAAIATVGPLVVAAGLGSTAGTWLSLGGFLGALADPGGSYRDRAVAMSAVTASTALAILLGSVAGEYGWSAVSVTFAIALVASLARVWDAAGASVGGASLSAFVIALAYPSSLDAALTRAGFTLVGGAWAMTLALILWRLRPYRPARVAVAGCYEALTGFVADIVATMSRATAEARPEVPVGSAAVRAALERARHVLAELRRGRPSTTGRGELLVVLAEHCDQLFGHLVAATEAIEAIPPVHRDAAAQLVMLETLRMIITTLRAIAVAVETEGDPPPVPLGWDGASLRALAEASQAGRVPTEAVLHYTHAAAVLDRAARFAETAAATALSLRNEGGTREHPLPIDTVPAEVSSSLLTTLRATMTTDSVIMRYALRVAVVTAVAVLIGRVFDLKRAYWITITVIVILQPYTGATTVKALQRVIGTVVGGVLTAVLGAYFHELGAVLVLAFVLVAACVALMPVNYAAYSVFLTPTFVLLAEASAGDWHLAGTRVENTLLGGVLALAGARLLWPSPEWNRLPGYMVATLRANAAYLRTVGRLFEDQSAGAGEELRAARRDIGVAVMNAEESFQRLMGEHRGPMDELAPAIAFLTMSRRFTASTASLALARHGQAHGSAESLAPVVAAMGATLDDLADAVGSARPPAPRAALDSMDAALSPLAPLLRARVERLVRQLRMLSESVERGQRSASARGIALPGVTAAPRSTP